MIEARNLSRQRVLAAPLESAHSLWGRFVGLMGRAALPDGTGLWLPGTNGIHMFFMRFAIDAVFLGRERADGTRPVVSMHTALPAWRGIVPFIRHGDGVLELPVGTIARTATEVGDTVSIGEPPTEG